MVDQFIGNYKILKKIGAGGMAQVYLAVHKDVPNLKVVLKVLSDPRLVERFRQEADKLALLDGHGHICQIKHFFNHGDEIVIAMEYIDGETLDEIIKEKQKLPIGDALRIIRDVLETLEFAHKKGICHRDIKPSNIMLDRDQQAKVIDFGIAKGETDPDLTVAGSSCGTPAYMAPEQFTPTVKANYVLADIYAVGTTLYYLATGQLPFDDENIFMLRDAKMFSDPTRPRKFNPEISHDLENLILKALAKTPEDRFGSAAEMKTAICCLLKDFEPALKDTATLNESQDLARKRSGRTPKKGRRNIIVPAVLGLIAVAVAAVIYLWPETKIELPSAPLLTSPAINAETDAFYPSFSWEAITGENITYGLQYGSDSLLSDAVEIDLSLIHI